MDNVLFSIGGLTLFKNALVICLGVLACALLTMALYKRETGSAAPVVCVLPFAFLLSAFFARLLHWYFTGYAYDSFIQAFTDFSVGSFALPGLIIGVLIAVRLSPSPGPREPGLMLDCAAPGLALLTAAIRFSSFFTNTCIGNRNVESKLFQWSPLSIAITDNAGNTDYRLRVYFIEGTLMLLTAVLLLILFKKLLSAPHARSYKAYGDLSKLFIVIFACVEIVMDSIRNDSILMRFRFLHKLNPYSSFISLAQVFAMGLLIWVFVHYLVRSARVHGFGRGHALSIALFLLCAVLIGGTGEFCIQRFGMVKFILTVKTWGYISMLLGCTGIALLIRRLYGQCLDPADNY